MEPSGKRATGIQENQAIELIGIVCTQKMGNGMINHVAIKKRFVCMLPTTQTIKSSKQLFFSSKNISIPALQFRYVAKAQQDIQKNRPGDKAESKI